MSFHRPFHSEALVMKIYTTRPENTRPLREWTFQICGFELVPKHFEMLCISRILRKFYVDFTRICPIFLFFPTLCNTFSQFSVTKNRVAWGLAVFFFHPSRFINAKKGFECLTHNMAMIQPLFTSSKWNMGEILPFLAKMMMKSGLEKFFLKLLHAELIHFTK